MPHWQVRNGGGFKRRAGQHDHYYKSLNRLERMMMLATQYHRDNPVSVQRFRYFTTGLPKHLRSVSRVPLDWLANHFGIFMASHVASFGVAPRHNPSTEVLLAFLATYFPKQHLDHLRHKCKYRLNALLEASESERMSLS